MSKPRVGVTAARKGVQLATAFERRGADVLLGPTVGGDRPADDSSLAAAIDRLVALQPRWFAASTGIGMRLLSEAADRTDRRAALIRALEGATTVARGAKAAAALQQLGIAPAWVAPDERDAHVDAWLAGRVQPGHIVGVQLHGSGGNPLELVTRAGAAMETITPYVSARPDDTQPGTRLAEAIAAHGLDVVTFTSTGAVHGLADLAGTAGLNGEVRAALTGPVAVAVVGPVTREAATRSGYSVTVEPSNHRSGALVRAVMQWWADHTTGARSARTPRQEP